MPFEPGDVVIFEKYNYRRMKTSIKRLVHADVYEINHHPIYEILEYRPNMRPRTIIKKCPKLVREKWLTLVKKRSDMTASQSRRERKVENIIWE